jgi:ABC-2 type transport system permease protein
VTELGGLLWVEFRKAWRSKMWLWTSLGSLFLPLAIAFLLFVARNEELSHKLGLVGTKANLVAYSGADWTAYLGLFIQMVSAGVFFLLVISISWVFGREFTDGTVKDLLAVPVRRSSILLAKFILIAVWAVLLTVVILVSGFLMGMLLNLPGGSVALFLGGSGRVLLTACLVTLVVLPFAFFASAGRGYLLPLGMAVLALLMANLAVVIGWGEVFPWSIPLIMAQAKEPLPPASTLIVILTGLAGMAATWLWWKNTDQSR